MRRRTVDPVMVEQRAASFTKRSIKAEAKAWGLRLALSMLDLTTLEGKDSPEKVRSVCAKAVRPFERDEEVLGERLPSCAAVCVYPSMVGVAREELDRLEACTTRVTGRLEARTRVKVASVATAFPSGQYPLSVRVRDTEEAIAAGAHEIDMVISRGLFLSGRDAEVGGEIREIASVCLGRAHLKVILETGELETCDNVRRASEIAIGALSESGLAHEPGAAFIKTSTGKVQPAATMPVTLVMLEAIRDHYLSTGEMIGMKPAGGIRTAKQALHYLVMLHETLGVVDGAWMTPSLFRFGASSLANDLLRQIVKLKTGAYAAGYDFAET